MAENFSRADGWWPTGPGGKLQYWEKGKVKTPGTDAMKILRRTGSMAKDLIVKPGQMVATDVRNALSDVMKIGQYSKFTDKNGKRLTIFEARRKGLLKNYSREGGLAYHLENLGKDPFTDPTHPDYKGGGEEVGTMVDGVWQPKGTSTTNQPPVTTKPPVSNDGQEQGNTAVTGSNESQVTSQTAVTPITANDPEPHLGSWRRGSGESLKGANARTEKWLVSKGVDINQIAKHDRKEVYRNLRIGGPHIVNGMLQLNTGRRGANSRFSLKINQS